MGKKRRIRRSNKFKTKLSAHPIIKTTVEQEEENAIVENEDLGAMKLNRETTEEKSHTDSARTKSSPPPKGKRSVTRAKKPRARKASNRASRAKTRAKASAPSQ